MPDDKKNTFTYSLKDEQIREVERLKKAWFDHVLNSIERLAENLQCAKSESYKNISEAKENLRNEISLLRKEFDVDIDKMEKRLIRAVDVVSKTIDNIAVKEFRDELKKELLAVKKEHKEELKSIRTEGLTPLREDMIKLRLTMAKWGGLGGLTFSILFYVIKWVVPIIIYGLKHTQG